jgi:hypothetical protein
MIAGPIQKFYRDSTENNIVNARKDQASRNWHEYGRAENGM